MKTLVIGASKNPERYAYKATKMLLEKGHEIELLGLRNDTVFDKKIDNELIDYKDIDTVTLYVGPKNQTTYYDYIPSLRPRRVIFNPGTENTELQNLLKEKNILVEEACTLVLLSTGVY